MAVNSEKVMTGGIIEIIDNGKYDMKIVCAAHNGRAIQPFSLASRRRKATQHTQTNTHTRDDNQCSADRPARTAPDNVPESERTQYVIRVIGAGTYLYKAMKA